MRTITYKQAVTNENIDKICDRFINCCWIEKEIIGTENNVQYVVFEWTGNGIPQYPNISDLR